MSNAETPMSYEKTLSDCLRAKENPPVSPVSIHLGFTFSPKMRPEQMKLLSE